MKKGKSGIRGDTVKCGGCTSLAKVPEGTVEFELPTGVEECGIFGVVMGKNTRL